ncbi:chordin-like protein 2 [Branchiostoma floridae]|uniref:Chordin-like protein 2 n=1 Tax=Branchiostoma floridae TaxID=7739 RepID=A0A9J7N4N0_BRAFL|nr:chordin-like protein 2 [Branchiostoma floridae]
MRAEPPIDSAHSPPESAPLTPDRTSSVIHPASCGCSPVPVCLNIHPTNGYCRTNCHWMLSSLLLLLCTSERLKTRTMLWLAFLALTALARSTQASDDVEKDDVIRRVCRFDGKEYVAGDTWHPFLLPIGYVYCITCICKEDGTVSCLSDDCPKVTCDNPVYLPGECCRRCPEVTTPAPTTPPYQGQQCLFKGRTYQHGESFRSDGVFMLQTESQCVHCSCSEGNVFCALKTCTVPQCPNPIQLADSCCLQCPIGNITSNSLAEKSKTPIRDEEAYEVEEYDDTQEQRIQNDPEATFEHPLPELKGVAGSQTRVNIILANNNTNRIGRICVSSGQTYSHGEKWHPNLVPFGQMKCVICNCNDSKTTCNRVSCPPDSDLPCPNPRKVPGKCCSACVEEGDDETLMTTEGPIILNGEASEQAILEIPSKTGGKDNKKGTKRQGTKPCLKRRETHLVYSYQPQPEHATQSHKYALENVKQEMVELHVWEVIQGIIRIFKIVRLTTKEFEEIQKNDKQGQYKLLGATAESRVRKLKRRETNLQDMCTNNCKERIGNLFKVLKLKDTSKRNKCKN